MRTPSNIGQLLGDLQYQIMKVIWSQGGEATIREVMMRLPASKRPAFTTIMTVMNRLVKKKILSRREHYHCYLYRTRYDQDQLYHLITADMLKRIRIKFGDLAVDCLLQEAKRKKQVK